MKARNIFSRAASFFRRGRRQHHPTVATPHTPERGQTLAGLPPELILSIAAHLDSRKSLRATSKQINAILESVVLETIVVSVAQDSLDHGLAQLEALSRVWPRRGSTTRKLKIMGLRPGKAARAHSDKEIHKVKEDLLRWLPLCLASFTRVHTVELVLHHQDIPGAWQIVMDWLPTLQHLHTLTLNGLEASSATLRQLSFGGLRNLQTLSLSIKWPYASHQVSGKESLSQNLSRLVLQSPRLSSFDACIQHTSPHFIALFHKVFLACQKEPTEARANLTSLRVTGYISINPVSLLPFTGLTTLHLGGLEVGHRDDYPDVPSSNIWDIVRANKIFLEHISTELVPGFLDYLRSYSGLTTLSLTVAKSDIESVELYEELARHADSLVSLDVRSSSGVDIPSWGYGRKETKLLASCQNLQFLRIPGPASSDALKAFMKSTLAATLPCMPDLRTLCIDRCISQGVTDWRHRHQWAEEFSGPYTRRVSLPTIEVFARDTKETYFPELSADKASYRYRLCSELNPTTDTTF